MPADEIVVYEVWPDPNGVFDCLVVDDPAQAGEAAARAALDLWDGGDGEDEAPAATIICRTMKRAEFEALPEP